jgi:hypothetical protein
MNFSQTHPAFSGIPRHGGGTGANHWQTPERNCEEVVGIEMDTMMTHLLLLIHTTPPSAPPDFTRRPAQHCLIYIPTVSIAHFAAFGKRALKKMET